MRAGWLPAREPQPKSELRAAAEGSGHDGDAYVRLVLDRADDSEAERIKGVRQRGPRKFEALLYRSETPDNRQCSVGVYPPAPGGRESPSGGGRSLGGSNPPPPLVGPLARSARGSLGAR